MKSKNKPVIVIAVIVVLVLIIGIIFMRSRKGTSANKESEILPTEELMPTVDSSVKVDLTSSSKREALLSIDKIPNGTAAIEYSLSYETKQQGLQGVIGTISLSDEDKYEKRITLGTCSSGSCVYHEVVGTIKLSLKFSGEYGDRIFEKDFQL